MINPMVVVVMVYRVGCVLNSLSFRSSSPTKSQPFVLVTTSLLNLLIAVPRVAVKGREDVTNGFPTNRYRLR